VRVDENFRSPNGFCPVHDTHGTAGHCYYSCSSVSIVTTWLDQRIIRNPFLSAMFKQVRNFATNKYQLRHVCLPIRMEQLGSHHTKFREIFYMFPTNAIGKIQDSLASEKNNGYFIWIPIYIFDYASLIYLEWKMFQTKVVEKIETHILCSMRHPPPPPRKSCRSWDVKKIYATPQQATDDSYQLTKATDTNSEYVIPTAFPQQQWLRERKLILGFTHIACVAIRASNGVTSKPFSAA